MGWFIFSHKFSNLLICYVLPHLSLQHFLPPPPLCPLIFFFFFFPVLCYHSNQYSLVYFVFVQRYCYSSFPESVKRFFCNRFFLPTPALLSFFLSPMAERTSSPQWQLIEVAHMQFHQFSLHLQNISGEPLQVLLTVLSVIAADSRARS